MVPLVILAVLLAACSPAPPPPVHARPDPAKEAWYGQTVEELTAMAREAGAAFHHGRMNQAAALITQGQPLIRRLLSVPQPTLPAMEAVSDLDQLYGQMLLGNRHYVWARDLFQKNLIRWSTWKPQTGETRRRLQLARAALAECDRRMTE
ncbi:MAG TPA: hypothetical protein VME43_26845 [Bryobacteraceae bacterium]|nr:hypothetical protein [Bryobacteraceae bacterium]